MAAKLILLGLLWLMAIAIISFAAYKYFNDSQHLDHEKEMYELKNDE